MTPHPDKELLAAHADGAAPLAERERLSAHLGECADCRREVEEQRAVSKLVAGLPQAELPTGFLARLERKRRGEEEALPAGRLVPGLSPLRLAAFAATGVLVCLIFFHEVRYRMAPEMLGAPAASDEIQPGPVSAKALSEADAEQAAVAQVRQHVAERGAWSGPAAPAAAPAFVDSALDAGRAGKGAAPARATLKGGALAGTAPSSSNEEIHAYLEKEKSRMGIQAIVPPGQPAREAKDGMPDHPVSREEAMEVMRRMTRQLTRINRDAMDKKRPGVELGSGSVPRLLAENAPSKPVAEDALKAEGAENALAAAGGSISMVRGEGARVDEPASFEPAAARPPSAEPRAKSAKKSKAAGRALAPRGSWSSTLGGLGKAGGAVITKPEDWADLWSRVGRAEPLPSVDFAKEMAVAVFGERDEAAQRSIEIVSLGEEDGALLIRYRVKTEKGPGPSAPYGVVVTPKSELPFRFVQVP